MILTENNLYFSEEYVGIFAGRGGGTGNIEFRGDPRTVLKNEPLALKTLNPQKNGIKHNLNSKIRKNGTVPYTVPSVLTLQNRPVGWGTAEATMAALPRSSLAIFG